MSKFWLTMVGVAGIAGAALAQDAAPAATLVFGFEDDAWKAGKFSSENGKITIEEKNATEGKKALALTFDRAGKTESDRPTVRIDKAVAFIGAKKILVDVTFEGKVDSKTKIRAQFKDTAKATASAEETLTEGKSTIEVDMTTCDAAKVSSGKICLDNCKSGSGVLYIDNIRVQK